LINRIRYQEQVGKYVLNGHGIKNVLLFLTAFLFHNGLINDRIQFFTDGHNKMLNDIILKCFSWYKNIGIILDWYHLEKRCKENDKWFETKGLNFKLSA